MMNASNKKKKKLLTVRDITLIGMMVAVIEACKMAMTFLPNIELTSFWIIVFTLFFGWKMVFVMKWVKMRAVLIF
jgi:energy-coupling factor transport system substrate-specific component